MKIFRNIFFISIFLSFTFFFPTKNIPEVYAGTPPNLTAWDLDMNAGIMTLHFDETVSASTLDASGITVQDAATANFSYTLTGGTTASSDGADIVVDLSSTDLNELKISDPTYFTARSQARSWIVITSAVIQNTTSDPVSSITDGSALQVSTFTSDTTPPVLASWDLNMDSGVVALHFDEPVQGTSIPTGDITIQDAATASQTVSIASNQPLIESDQATTATFTLPANVVEDLKLNPALAKSAVDTYLILPFSNAVPDLVNNEMDPINDGSGVQVNLYTPDTTPPTVTAAELDYGGGILTIHLDEPIHVSLTDQTKFHINNATGTDDVTLTNPTTTVANGKVLRFTLTPPQKAAALAISGEPGGDGGAVVLDVDANGFFDMALVGNSNAIDDNNVVTESEGALTVCASGCDFTTIASAFGSPTLQTGDTVLVEGTGLTAFPYDSTGETYPLAFPTTADDVTLDCQSSGATISALGAMGLFNVRGQGQITLSTGSTVQNCHLTLIDLVGLKDGETITHNLSDATPSQETTIHLFSDSSTTASNFLITDNTDLTRIQIENGPGGVVAPNTGTISGNTIDPHKAVGQGFAINIVGDGIHNPSDITFSNNTIDNHADWTGFSGNLAVVDIENANTILFDANTILSSVNPSCDHCGTIQVGAGSNVSFTNNYITELPGSTSDQRALRYQPSGSQSGTVSHNDFFCTADSTTCVMLELFASGDGTTLTITAEYNMFYSRAATPTGQAIRVSQGGDAFTTFNNDYNGFWNLSQKLSGQIEDDRNLTGTISSSGTAVTGTGTLFTSELQVGEALIVPGQVTPQIITTIADDTHLTVQTSFSPDASSTSFSYRPTLTSSGTSVTALGSHFTAEVHVGDVITLNGSSYTATIASIIDNTHLTLDAGFTADAAGEIYTHYTPIGPHVESSDPVLELDDADPSNDLHPAPFSAYFDVNGAEDIGAFGDKATFPNNNPRRSIIYIDDTGTLDYSTVDALSVDDSIIDSLRNGDTINIAAGTYAPFVLEPTLDLFLDNTLNNMTGNIAVHGQGSNTIVNVTSALDGIVLEDLSNINLDNLLVHNANISSSFYVITKALWTFGSTIYDQSADVGAPPDSALLITDNTPGSCDIDIIDADGHDVTTAVGAGLDDWNVALANVNVGGPTANLTIYAPNHLESSALDIKNYLETECTGTPGSVTIDQFIPSIFTANGDGTYNFNASAASTGLATLKIGETNPPSLQQEVSSFAGLKLVNTNNSVIDNVALTNNGYGIWLSGSSSGNSVNESDLSGNAFNDIKGDSSADNDLKNDIFDRTTSDITGTGVVNAWFKARGFVKDASNIPISGASVDFTDALNSLTTMLVTDISGFTPFTGNLLGYIMTNSSIAETNGGYNPYAITATTTTPSLTNTLHQNLNAQNQTFDVTLSSSPTPPSSEGRGASSGGFMPPSVSTVPIECSHKGDLNHDCRVNLVDFSIASFWYQKPLSEDIKLLDQTSLNGDNIINLVDFSIMSYYWTG